MSAASSYAEVLRLLTEHGEWRDPHRGREELTLYEHALQAATRAERAGLDEEMVVACLLHEVGRPFNGNNHGAVIAEILRGRLEAPIIEALRHYVIFRDDALYQTGEKDQYRGEPWYVHAIALASIDVASFDPSYEAHGLAHFLHPLRKVMSR